MRISSLLLLAAFCLQAQAAVGVRVIFGLADRGETKWDGSATARSGHIASIEPWRFEGTDAVQGTSWTASTHEVRLFGGRGLFGQTVQVPHVANGVVLYLDQETEDTEIDVKTAQGKFTIRLRDIPYGKVTNALNNRVMLDRLPPYHQLTSSPEEQDYPAAVSRQERQRLAGLHGVPSQQDHDRLRANLQDGAEGFHGIQGAHRRRSDFPDAKILGRERRRADRHHASRRRPVSAGCRSRRLRASLGVLVAE